MDQRTRERLPVLPAPGRRRRPPPQGRRRPPGSRAGRPARRDVHRRRDDAARARLATPCTRTWAEDPGTGKRRDLTREEDNAFWAWAAIEVLRETGIRIEELTELSHHSLVQYRLPVNRRARPAAAHRPVQDRPRTAPRHQPRARRRPVSAVISAIRDQTGSRPPRGAYDRHEKTWNPPMPLLFQRRIGLENRPDPASRGIRDLLNSALAAAGHHRHRRQAPHVHPPRLPQDLHHRRDHERHAAAHRPAHPRPPRHQHHHGLQGRLPRGSHQRPPGVHRPPPRSYGPARNTAPPPTPNGKSSSATSSAASSPSATADGHTAPAASTSTAASAAPSCASTPPSGTGSKKSATTCRPHRRSRTRRLDRRSRRTPGQPRRRQQQARPGRRPHRPPPGRGDLGIPAFPDIAGRTAATPQRASMTSPPR